MILYHGSYLEIPSPDLKHSRLNVDFGRGFYMTPLREQAAKWCQKFIRRHMDGVLSKYVLDDAALREMKVLRFDAYSEAWLDFTLRCRMGQDATDFDIIIGGVANDKVFRVCF